MSERLQTLFLQRSSAKGRITRVAKRFVAIREEADARETVLKLRDDMPDALSKLNGVDTDFIRQLNAEVGAERSITARSVADYVADVDEYIIKAEHMMFEAGRYLDKHAVVPLVNNTTTPTPVVK